MIKKILLGALLAVSCLAAAAFFARNYLLQRLLTAYVKDSFQGECNISSTDVSFGKISIYDFSFSNPNCKVVLKRGIVTFKVSWAPLITVSSARLEEGKLTVTDFENLKKQLTPVPSQGRSGATPVSVSGASFSLKKITLDFENINNTRVTAELSLSLRLKKDGGLSAGDIVVSRFSADSDGFTVRAEEMRGTAAARLGKGILQDIRVELADNAGGLINVKDEKALDFLRRYMDDRSFKALVDNFRNYAYNIGTAAVHRQGRDVIVETEFDSPVMGHRDFVVNFHDLLGGER